MMVSIPVWVARLAVEFLDKYSDVCGNAGCNDYTPPEFVPLDELRAMLKDGLDNYDWAVVDAVQFAIEKSLNGD